MLNIVIPMAGKGSRFYDAGYTTPKPLIPINDKHMIEGVIDNLEPESSHRFIFICQQDHLDKYDLERKLTNKSSNCIVIPINQYTEGAACTVLLAKEYINDNNPLMIANSDQWVDIIINNYLKKMDHDSLDGLIMTMSANDPKWSFVRMNQVGDKVVEVVEKEVVSNEATVGIYNFSKGIDFCCAAENMILEDKRVNGEFYVAPVYNELIAQNNNIGIYNIGAVGNGMWGLGTPDDLDLFKRSEKSKEF